MASNILQSENMVNDLKVGTPLPIHVAKRKKKTWKVVVIVILALALMVYVGLIVRDQVQLRGTYIPQGHSPELVLRPSFFVPWIGTWQFEGKMVGGSNKPLTYIRHGNILSMKMDLIYSNGNEVWYECRIEGNHLNWMMVDVYTRR